MDVLLEISLLDDPFLFEQNKNTFLYADAYGGAKYSVIFKNIKNIACLAF